MCEVSSKSERNVEDRQMKKYYFRLNILDSFYTVTAVVQLVGEFNPLESSVLEKDHWMCRVGCSSHSSKAFSTQRLYNVSAYLFHFQV